MRTDGEKGSVGEEDPTIAQSPGRPFTPSYSLNEKDEARKMLADLNRKSSEDNYVSAYSVAIIYAGRTKLSNGLNKPIRIVRKDEALKIIAIRI